MFKKIALAAVTALIMNSAHAVPVTNGGFESGLTGWTCVTTVGGCFTGTQSGVVATEGVSYFYGFENSRPAGTLEQILATVAGGVYDISFDFNTNGSVPPNALSISVGDLVSSLPLASFTWSTYSGTFTAASASTALDFLFSTDGGSGTVFIDNVVVTARGVPEPSVFALFGLGLVGLVVSRRRKKQ